MSQRIPRHFHFVFGLKPQTEPFHLVHYLCLQSCIAVNRPERITLYYHYMPFGPYWDLIRDRLELVFVQLPEPVRQFSYQDHNLEPLRYAHHSDFIRLDKLIQHGGVYADIDTLFIRPLPDPLFDESFVIGRELDFWSDQDQCSQMSLCNAFLMSEPDSRFAIAWLDSMEDAFDGSWSNHSTLLPARLSVRHPDSLRVMERESFYAISPTAEDLFRLFEDDGPSHFTLPEDCISIHLWEHLWRSPSRQDFSLFHLGLLNDAYVRSGQTLYARLARPHLPDPPVFEPEPASGSLLSDLWQWCKACGGVVLIPILRRLGHHGGRLGLARGYFAHRRATAMFATRSNWDRMIIRWVLQWDEYGVLDRDLHAADVVIDVGGHLGSFTFASHCAGSRNIESFEPDPENFRLLSQNVGGLPGVSVHSCALFRNDRAAEPLLLSGYRVNDTGSSSLLGHGGIPVQVQPLDAVLKRHQKVAILKLDCEGSEFPMLLTSRELHRVQCILGEYHEISSAALALLPDSVRVAGLDSYVVEVLRNHLEAAGFRFSSRVVTPGRGMFEAVRP